MTNKQTFNEVKAQRMKTLKQYVPVVARVHGKNHPEFYEVKELFDVLEEKTREAGSKVPELQEEFAKLREITSNYTVPGDVCESFEAVYTMLAELDRAYGA